MDYIMEQHVAANVYGHRQLVLRTREWKFVAGSDLSLKTMNIVF
jgi:hypothetical protein